IRLYFPVRTSSATTSRIKSEGMSGVVVMATSEAIGERPDGQLARFAVWTARVAHASSRANASPARTFGVAPKRTSPWNFAVLEYCDCQGKFANARGLRQTRETRALPIDRTNV